MIPFSMFHWQQINASIYNHSNIPQQAPYIASDKRLLSFKAVRLKLDVIVYFITRQSDINHQIESNLYHHHKMFPSLWGVVPSLIPSKDTTLTS